MKPSIRKLLAFRLRSLLYKNFKKKFEKSADYQQWRFHRRETLEVQLTTYLKWRRHMDRENIEKLSRGAIKPSRFHLMELGLRSFLYRHLKTLLKYSKGYRHWRGFRNEPASVQIAAHLQWRMQNDKQPVPDILKGTIEEARNIQLATHEDPIVSVLIPVYNKIEYTLTCLSSIQRHSPHAPFEIIVLDDCSTDRTSQLLSQVKGIRVVRNPSNLGFLRNCNNAAKAARGEYLLFLNNDTEVHPGWLDEMVETFRVRPDTGLVGSKLLFPYGMQQEAGGIIWSDASGWNYGREASPERPEFCYVREADYCSGASLMIPADLFEELGGFDERYAPAYYEDTDLAFSVRKHGRKVMFQPFSKVTHHEGVSSGTDLTKGIKAYQLVNQAKFFEKWRETLANHGQPNQRIEFARERNVNKRVLLIDATTPTPDQDSGSVDTIYDIKVLHTLGYKVTFLPDDIYNNGSYTEALQRLGVECLYSPYLYSIKEHLESSGDIYDLVIVKRVNVASKHIEDIRRYCVNAKTIFNTVDLHFLREEREAIINNSAKLKEQARQTKALEYSVMKRSDVTIVISDTEREILAKEYPEILVTTVPYVRNVAEHCPLFSTRRDIVFIGGFRHAPNVDATLYFVQEIWPLVREAIPGVKFRIVGSNAPSEIRELEAHPQVTFEGYVPNLDTVFNNCRLSVAPLRFGAGIKGKIGTSLSYGVPCVASPLAVEGMQLTDLQEVLIASNPLDFAQSIIKAYNDETLWNSLSANGIAYMIERYSFEQGVERFRELIDSVNADSKMMA